MSKLIAIDNGHGLNTPGKRTPLFPDSSFMHEWEFNHAVAKYLEAELLRCGFKTLMLSDTEEDTPLQRRTDRCNKANADFCVSIHYNAMGNSWQTTATGTETYSYPGNSTDAKYASIIHPYLVQATGLKDRGCKQADFHMIREPKCPAILIEFGFMDNHIDADLALQDSFRTRCAVGLAKGICAAFEVEYIEEVDDTSKALVLQEDWQWTMLLENIKLYKSKGFISGDEWDKKVKDKSITVDELAWLNNEIISRIAEGTRA